MFAEEIKFLISVTGPDCFHVDRDYHGSDLSYEAGPHDPESCQRLCQSTPGCSAFTRVASSEGCFVKGEGAYESVAPMVGHVSGPRYCGDSNFKTFSPNIGLIFFIDYYHT